MTVGVAEEFICNTLKKKDNFTDVLIERQRLYGFEVVVGSGIQCWQYQYQKPPLPFQPPPVSLREGLSNGGFGTLFAG